MATELVLVNGLPGSGKTTLADSLAVDLGAPVLSKDRVKEALADALGPAAVGAPFGRVAMETVWSLAGSLSGLVMVDSWWFRPRDLAFAQDGITRSGARSAVEIWCAAPITVARARYEQRRRHDIHRDRRDMTGEWADWAARGEPLGLTPVLHVDTSERLDAGRVAEEVTRLLRT